MASLPRALASLPARMPVLVVDAESTDATALIADRHGATVIVRPWEGFGAARRFAIARVETPWALMLDADEALDYRQRAAIAELPEDPAEAGFRLARTTWLCGRPVRGCGWGEERLLRLFRTGAATIVSKPAAGGGADLHERWQVSGPVSDLPGTMAHHSYPTLASYARKFGRYTSIEAAALDPSAARPAAIAASSLRAVARALWLFIARAGWRDGWRGAFVSAASAAYPVVVRWKARKEGEGRVR